MGPHERLTAYLREVKGREFAWGVHDCLTFTNEGWRRMHGYGWADDWLGRYMDGDAPVGRDALRREFGFDDFAEAVDSRLTRCRHVPPRGALVAAEKGTRRWYTGAALGLCVGLRAAFLSDRGLIYLPVDDIKHAWVSA